jgi:hypothetical protein
VYLLFDRGAKCTNEFDVAAWLADPHCADLDAVPIVGWRERALG